MTKKHIRLSHYSLFTTNANPWFREGQPTEKGTTVSCILTDSLEFRARFVHVKGLYQPPPPLHKPWLKSSFFSIKVAKGYENTHISPDAQGRGLCTHPAGPVRPYSLLQKRIYDFVQKIELRWIDSRESVTNWSKGQHSLHLYYLASNCNRMYY